MSDGKQQSKTSLGFHFVAGLGSGCASAAILQPADLLKTRVQQSQAGSLRQALRNVLDGPDPIRSLWRGTTPSVIRTGLGSALYFGMLSHMREYLARMPSIPRPGLSPGSVGEGGGGGGSSSSSSSSQKSSSVLPKIGNVGNLATGAAARVAAGFIMNPVTVLKVRYESTHYSYTSMAGAARDIIKTEGGRGFFAGFGATAVRDAPYAGLYVLLYEQSKAQLAGLSHLVPGPDGQPGVRSMRSNATINFMSGVVAATAATTLTNPFDAIKTRLQIAPQKYRNMVQAARMMLAEEGVKSMFYGLSLRIGRKAISSALTWTVYEELIRRAERVVDDRRH